MSEMTRRGYMAKYGVGDHVIAALGVARLNAMPEDARALLIGLSKRPGPSKEAIKEAELRIRTRDRLARLAKQDASAKPTEMRKAFRAVALEVGSETVRMAPMASMGAEMLEAPRHKPTRANDNESRVRRMVELAARAWIA